MAEKKLCDKCERIDECVNNATKGNAQCLMYGKNKKCEEKQNE